MSLGLGFEYQGLPPVPVVTVIEQGGAADRAGCEPSLETCRYSVGLG